VNPMFSGVKPPARRKHFIGRVSTMSYTHGRTRIMYSTFNFGIKWFIQILRLVAPNFHPLSIRDGFTYFFRIRSRKYHQNLFFHSSLLIKLWLYFWF
jgi:hypothetical protein